jgi:hypothetical protein
MGGAFPLLTPTKSPYQTWAGIFFEAYAGKATHIVFLSLEYRAASRLFFFILKYLLFSGSIEF